MIGGLACPRGTGDLGCLAFGWRLAHDGWMSTAQITRDPCDPPLSLDYAKAPVLAVTAMTGEVFHLFPFALEGKRSPKYRVPKDMTVDHMEITVGGRVIPSVIEEPHRRVSVGMSWVIYIGD